MKTIRSIAITALLCLPPALQAAVIVVNTTNSLDPSSKVETSLAQAIELLQDGDQIHFNIPPPMGSDVLHLPTPPGGYPKITKHNVTIDGYTQPGAMANTNTILGSNTARIKIVLDSRNGQFREMTYEPGNANAGFTEVDGAILGIHAATNVHLRGLCFLGLSAGFDTTNSLGDPFDETHAIAIARDLNGSSDGAHISGCWFGVDVDRTSVFSCDNAISSFRHRNDTIGISSRLPTASITVGVKAGSTNPRAEFNVIVGHAENCIMEGQRHRVSGNFLGVMPDGMHDYILPFAQPGRFAEAHLEFGRGASDLVIGTDGDGINDAEERNVMGGVVTDGSGGSFDLGGYQHVIELYSLGSSPGPDRTRIRIAGNYIGVAIDGMTRFTNGVPAFDGDAVNGSQYWVGSDFDGVSDDIEANVVFNNHPPWLFYESAYTNSSLRGDGSHGFFDTPNSNALYAVRGNVLVNNYPFPVNPGRDGGSFITNYVNKALETRQGSIEGLYPVLSPASTTARLIGTVPAANASFPWTIIDLYLPDPEGLVNGLVLPDPNLPNGWVQGLRCLGSFLLGSSADRDPSPGGFAFDICALGLAPGTLVTVSANYSKDPPGTHNARVLTSLFSAPVALPKGITIMEATRAGTTLTIRWCGGDPPYQLQKKRALADERWIDVGGSTMGFAATDTGADAAQFYRVVGN